MDFRLSNRGLDPNGAGISFTFDVVGVVLEVVGHSLLAAPARSLLVDFVDFSEHIVEGARIDRDVESLPDALLQVRHQPAHPGIRQCARLDHDALRVQLLDFQTRQFTRGFFAHSGQYFLFFFFEGQGLREDIRVFFLTQLDLVPDAEFLLQLQQRAGLNRPSSGQNDHEIRKQLGLLQMVRRQQNDLVALHLELTLYLQLRQ